MDEFVFFPAMASFENVPYGGFSYDNATIMQGFIDAFAGWVDKILG